MESLKYLMPNLVSPEVTWRNTGVMLMMQRTRSGGVWWAGKDYYDELAAEDARREV